MNRFSGDREGAVGKVLPAWYGNMVTKLVGRVALWYGIYETVHTASQGASFTGTIRRSRPICDTIGLFA